MNASPKAGKRLWLRPLATFLSAAAGLVIYGGLFAISDYFELAVLPAVVGVLLCAAAGYVLGGSIGGYVGILGWFAAGAYVVYMYMWFMFNIMAYESGHPTWAATNASYWAWLGFSLPTSFLAFLPLGSAAGTGQFFFFTFPLPNALWLACSIGYFRRARARRAATI